MKRYNCFWIFVLMLVTSTTWAYGGGGSSSTKACAKPKFTDFVPAENAEVAAGSNFSFTASANTYPSSIKVTIKGLPATIKVTPKTVGTFEVSGSLPTSLKGTYARIAIEADAQSKCNGGGGWLVKIAE
ncbi:MAG: hypothetical protein NTU70_08640 [Methylococcales bacterium]|jgi:hypothetical protein|nr:hypothetical protein [Methylococcales bacterium]OTE95821.1 hypothetical protein BCS42_14395 [Crenothrix sp. D3]